MTDIYHIQKTQQPNNRSNSTSHMDYGAKNIEWYIRECENQIIFEEY